MFGVFKNLFTGNSQELTEAIKNGAYLVDVRTPEEFSSGSVNGAVNIPLDRISGQLAKFKGKEQIVVFCRSGARSGQAKSILERNGIQHVFNGGSWQQVAQIKQG
ncbi:rhodanese-like domain-containing protein [Fluviicola sp.]|uniref:rhodanese-like domain-containing protein n=1 Tax=Fluviicola sp. TaxID=1917219 RepID=UPI002604DA72|nr:rhodanese-like domain-containing protein [Fluviicola sp.]